MNFDDALRKASSSAAILICVACDILTREDRDKKTIFDWTSLKRRVWREKVPENGTQAVIGQFGERNVVRVSAAVLLGNVA